MDVNSDENSRVSCLSSAASCNNDSFFGDSLFEVQREAQRRASKDAKGKYLYISRYILYIYSSEKYISYLRLFHKLNDNDIFLTSLKLTLSRQ